MNDHSFTGNLKNYNITLDPSDFDNYGFDLNLYSLIDPYRPQDGIINAGDEYFAWLAAVPNGEVEGTVMINGVKKKLKEQVTMITTGAILLFRNFSAAGHGLEGKLVPIRLF